MNRRLVMIGGWTEVYSKAKEIGFHLTVIQSKEQLIGSDLPFIDRVITCEMEDPLVPQLAAFLHAETAFDAAVSFQERGIVNAGVIGDQLKLAANPLKPVLLTRDKGKMRDHMERTGLPSIPYLVVRDPAQVVEFGNACGWPVILKPASGSGSRQIHKIVSPDDVAAAFAAILVEFPDIHPISEKFIEGPEVSVEAFSWNGVHNILTVTDKITTGAPRFVETGHNMPSALACTTIAAINKLTIAFLDSIEHKHGPTHTELIISASGPVIVESHTRTGGDRIFDMVELVHGVDMIKSFLEGLYSGDPTLNIKPATGAAIRFLTLPPGTVTALSGLDEARESTGVVRCDINLEVGAVLNSFNNSTERHGCILAVGGDRAEAIKNVTAAMNKINVSVS
jgi:biotin carboxylase